jgi:tRNA(Ile)-lysidine synthase
VSTADDAAPVSPEEARALFADLVQQSALILAVSGGPDSTALLLLAARWRKALGRGPDLIAVTIDHGLRPDARLEALAVRRLARSLGVAHRTLRWTGRKPATGVQQAARVARYRLLAAAARRAGASHVLTGHTLDDQAETVLIRLARGSGVAGLAAMDRRSPVPGCGDGLVLVRPLLGISKARLAASLAGVATAQDPSNGDPRFTRVRLRGAMPALAGEGLSARRLALLAQRVRRADTALEAAVDQAAAALAAAPWRAGGPISLAAQEFRALPDEIALRLLGRAVARVGDEGPVELGKLEALTAALAQTAADARLRRTLAGAVITLGRDRLEVTRAPPRRAAGLTKRKAAGRKLPRAAGAMVE